MSDAHAVARDQLLAFITRIERLEEEKKTIADDIKDIYGEAKGTGFDTKILRKVIAIRKQDRDERAEQEAILDSYLAALGMLSQPDFFEDEPRQPSPAERRPAEPLRSDAGLTIVTKHIQITNSGGTSTAPTSLTTREAEESVVPHSPETATEVQSASTDAPETPGKQCTSVVSKDEAGQNLTGNRSPDQPLTGGDHEVTGIAERERETVTSNTGEGTALSALPAKTSIRPLCRNPGDRCGGYGRKHCRACETAAAELEDVE